MAITLLIASLLADVWLLSIVYRRDVRRRLPWFVLYVLWGVSQASIQLAARAVIPRLYSAVYWWMETVAIVLIVGAVRESFLRIFIGFTKMPWFRWAVTAVIALVFAYSAWKAVYAPPIEGNRLTSFVVGAEFLFRWGIAAIGVLTLVLNQWLDTEGVEREDAVLIGFTLISGTFVAHLVIVSLFGTRYLFLSGYLPSVGYFVAVFLWIRVFSRPVTGIGFKELGLEPEDARSEMRRYREALQEIGKEIREQK